MLLGSAKDEHFFLFSELMPIRVNKGSLDESSIMELNYIKSFKYYDQTSNFNFLQTKTDNLISVTMCLMTLGQQKGEKFSFRKRQL